MSNSNKPTIRKALNQVMVPKERVISKGQGCWNCKSWDRDKAKPLWTEKRQNDLNTALTLALDAPDGEDNVRVRNIRSMVDSLDHLVASGHVGCCTGGGKTANDEPVGDFVVHSFLCGSWNGMVGASLACIDGKLDALPEETADKLNTRTLVADEMADSGFVKPGSN